MRHVVHVLRHRALAALGAVVLLPLLAVPAAGAQPGVASSATEPVRTGTALADATAAGWVVPDPPERLEISTAGGAPIVSKDDYLDATMRLDGVTHTLQIKGRGNSTWTWPKKPYRLKLTTAASLLGMPVERDWVLLANFADRSALRTQLALQLGAQTRLPWTARTRYVDVVLNGSPAGLYLLTEQVEQSPARVNLPPDGYLLEVDYRYETKGDPGFRTARGLPIAYKDPDELTAEQQQQVQQAVNDFETVLYGPDFADPVKGYAAYVDIDSFVDWYLVEELFKNEDAAFRTSVHFTWSPGGEIAMSPLWDFDLSAGTLWRKATPPEGWHIRLGDHWLARMVQDPAFAERVRARWAALRPTVDDMVDQIAPAADVIAPAALADWELWHTSTTQVAGSIHADSFRGEVAFLERWLAARVAWLSSNKVGFGNVPRLVGENSAVLHLPVSIGGNAVTPATVRYAPAGGTATAGSDFWLTPGVLTFGPGETIKTIPVRIRRDTKAESAETIQIALSSPSAGTVLGARATSTVTIKASDQRPDAVIRDGSGRFVGDDVYNRNGEGQTARKPVRRGATHSFVTRIYNDGTRRNTFTLRGSVPVAGSRVRYLVGTTDVTRAMRSSAGWPLRLAPDRHRRVTVRVKVLRSAEDGSRKRAVLSSSWAGTGDGTRSDLVKAVVRVTR